MKKRKRCVIPAQPAGVVFLPALTPLEAAVLPAQERRHYGALRMAVRACEPGNRDQRAKIWVR